MPAPAEHAQDLVQHLRECLAKGARASAPQQALGTRLSAIPLRTLPTVDQILRSNSFSFTDGWYEMSPPQLAKFAGAPESWAFVALASCHGSGFVRQAALRELGRRRDPRGLPFIAIRLNDWVAEVRVAAQAALTGFLYANFAPALVATLPLLFSLERQRRGDHAVVVAWVRTLLQSPDCRGAVLDGCLSEDAEVRRLSYRLAIAAEGAEPAPILAQALSDAQVVIRVWAVRTAASDVTRPWARDVALQALSNRSVQVRSVALQSLADVLPPEDLRRLAEKALLDESATARWQARMLRSRLGAFDLPEFYRRALATAATNPRRRAALLGLGESGKPQDIPLVRDHLLAGPMTVRRAALRALASLEPLTTVEPFFVALTDSQAGLSREARRALEPRVNHVPVALLAAIVRSTELPAHARRNATSLANQLSKWDALPVLLEAWSADEPEVTARGLALLRAWVARYNRSFVLPTHTQLDRADEVLRRSAGLPEVNQPRDIREIVRQARKFAKG